MLNWEFVCKYEMQKQQNYVVYFVFIIFAVFSQ